MTKLSGWLRYWIVCLVLENFVLGWVFYDKKNKNLIQSNIKVSLIMYNTYLSFTDSLFPIDIAAVAKDHDFLDQDSIEALFRYTGL